MHLQMASAGTYKQDLPPKGGYAPINFKRIPARSVLSAPIIFGGLIGTTALGIWIYKRGTRQWQILVNKENISATRYKSVVGY